MFGVLYSSSLYVCGEGECVGERGSVLVCVQVLVFTHSTADAWAVLRICHGSTPLTSCTHT